MASTGPFVRREGNGVRLGRVPWARCPEQLFLRALFPDWTLHTNRDPHHPNVCTPPHSTLTSNHGTRRRGVRSFPARQSLAPDRHTPPPVVPVPAFPAIPCLAPL